jgi:Neocarzinostatin family
MRARTLALTLLVTAGSLVATAAPAAAASVRVAPSSGVADGQSVTVTGSGFDPNRNNRFGVYVVFGPRTANFSKDANLYASAVWVHAGGGGGGQAPLSPSGAFSVRLTAKARYTDGNGRSVDCLATRCHVITMAAHGVPDRSQDTFTPITFKGAGGTSGSGGSSGSGGAGTGSGQGSGTGQSTGAGTGTGSAPTTGATSGAGPTPGSGAGQTTPGTATPGARPQAAPGGFATPVAPVAFEQTATSAPARSPWLFWLSVGAVLVAAVAARRFLRRRVR